MGEYTKTMRAALQKLTVKDVNKAIQKHIDPSDFKIVFITKDAEGLKQKLLSDAPSAVKYDGDKPKELLAEDAVIGAEKLGIKTVAIVPVDQVFATAGGSGPSAASENRSSGQK